MLSIVAWNRDVLVLAFDVGRRTVGAGKRVEIFATIFPIVHHTSGIHDCLYE